MISGFVVPEAKYSFPNWNIFRRIQTVFKSRTNLGSINFSFAIVGLFSVFNWPAAVGVGPVA
jgi:hypothetical protein